jgi:hypothetical protein
MKGIKIVNLSAKIFDSFGEHLVKIYSQRIVTDHIQRRVIEII